MRRVESGKGAELPRVLSLFRSAMGSIVVTVGEELRVTAARDTGRSRQVLEESTMDLCRAARYSELEGAKKLFAVVPRTESAASEEEAAFRASLLQRARAVLSDRGPKRSKVIEVDGVESMKEPHIGAVADAMEGELFDDSVVLDAHAGKWYVRRLEGAPFRAHQEQWSEPTSATILAHLGHASWLREVAMSLPHVRRLNVILVGTGAAGAEARSVTNRAVKHTAIEEASVFIVNDLEQPLAVPAREFRRGDLYVFSGATRMWDEAGAVAKLAERHRRTNIINPIAQSSVQGRSDATRAFEAFLALRHDGCVLWVDEGGGALVAKANGIRELAAVEEEAGLVGFSEALHFLSTETWEEVVSWEPEGVGSSYAATAQGSGGGWVRQQLRDAFKEVVGRYPPEESEEPLWAAGLTSLAAVNLTTKLQERLGCELPSTLLFDYPHREELERKLAEAVGMSEGGGSDARGAKEVDQDAGGFETKRGWPILATSVVPPGNVEGIAEAWQQDAIGRTDLARWDAEAPWLTERQGSLGLFTRFGGIHGEVETFDPEAFRMSTTEAGSVDPQQRLVLLRSLECIQSTASQAAKEASVFVGISQVEYPRVDGAQADYSPHSAPGAHLSAAAGRVSFTFGLTGECAAGMRAISFSHLDAPFID